MRCGPHPFTGAEIMLKQRFRIVDAPAFDRLGQPAVNLSYFVRSQLAGKSVANAIVIKFQPVFRSSSAQELSRPQ